MDAWDSRAKFAVLDEYGYRRMKVKVASATGLTGLGWFPNWYIKLRGTDEEWRRTKTAQGLNPTWDQEFDLDLDGGQVELELWEAAAVNHDGFFGKLLSISHSTESLATDTLRAVLTVHLTDITEPFPEKDTAHEQKFYLHLYDTPPIPVGELPHSRLVLDFTPVNFGTQPSLVIRKYFDTKELLLHRGDPLMKGFGPRFDSLDMTSVIQGVSLMTDDEIYDKAQFKVRVADVQFYYYYFNYFEHVYYFKVHLRVADERFMLHQEGALDRHQVTALASFHAQYLVAVLTQLVGLTTISLKTLIEKKEGAHHQLKELYEIMTKAGFTHRDVEKREPGDDDDDEEPWGLLPELYRHLFLDEDTSKGRALEMEFMEWFFAPTDAQRITFGSDFQKKCEPLTKRLQERSQRVLERLLDDAHFLL